MEKEPPLKKIPPISNFVPTCERIITENVQSLTFKVEGLWFEAAGQGSGFRFEVLGFEVLGFRV